MHRAQKKKRGGREVGRVGKVTWVVSNVATSPDGSGGRTLKDIKGRASQFHQTYCRGKSPPQRVCQERSHKETLEVLAKVDGSLWDLPVPEKHLGPHVQVPFCAVSMCNSPRVWMIWPVLPGVCSHGAAGSSWILFEQPYGRWQPVCHPGKMCQHNAKGYSIGPLYLWRAPPLLESISAFCCCGLCLGCWYGEENNSCM